MEIWMDVSRSEVAGSILGGDMILFYFRQKKSFYAVQSSVISLS